MRFFLVSTLLFWWSFSFSQKGQEPLFIDFTQINNTLANELKIKSMPIDTSFRVGTIARYDNGNFIETKNPEPISFRRDSVDYLPLTTEYYYDIEDSTITSIIYDWERFKGIDWKKKKELLKEESTKSILYQKEFDRIYNHLIKSQGLNSGKCKITHSGKVCKWTKEVSEIHLELIHSPNTCRIRLW